MNLREILDLIASSQPADWHVPGYIRAVSAYNAFPNGLPVLSHDQLAVHVGHPEVSIVWGMPLSNSLHWPLATWPDDAVDHTIAVDVLLNGAIVHHDELMVVLAEDGPRPGCYLPLPYSIGVDVEPYITEGIAETVTHWDVAFARLIDGLSGHEQFDRWFKLSAFIEVAGHPLDRR